MNNDASNWFGPNIPAVMEGFASAGFDIALRHQWGWRASFVATPTAAHDLAGSYEGQSAILQQGLGSTSTSEAGTRLRPATVTRRPENQPSVNPAFTASLRNISTVSSENCVEVLADQLELLEDVVGGGDDVAADGVGLEDVQELARARPEQLGVRRQGRVNSRAAAIIGTGSRPVSAMRPANTDTTVAAPPLTARHTSRTWASVIRAVTLSFTPDFDRRSMSGIEDSPRVFVIGIFT